LINVKQGGSCINRQENIVGLNLKLAIAFLRNVEPKYTERLIENCEDVSFSVFEPDRLIIYNWILSKSHFNSSDI
jgi:hypothetical protein